MKRGVGRFPIVLLLVLGTWARSRGARAQTPPQPEASTVQLGSGPAAPSVDPILLQVRGCSPHAARLVQGLMGLELSPREIATFGELDAVGARTARTQAELACEPEAAVLRVSERGDGGRWGGTLELRLELSRTPEAARPRLMALALSELVVTSALREPPAARPRRQAMRQDVGASAVRAPSPSASTRGHRAERASERVVWAPFVAAGLGWVAEPAVAALSLQGGSLWTLGALGVWANARFDAAERAEDVAETSTFASSAGVGPTLRFWQREVWRAYASLGARVGYVSLAARATDPELVGRKVAGWWSAPSVGLALHRDVDRRVALRGAVDFEYVVAGVRGLDAEGDALQAWQGATLVGTLGIAF